MAVESGGEAATLDDNGGFNPDWDEQANSRIGQIDSTPESRAAVQALPSNAPPSEDPEERKCLAVSPVNISENVPYCWVKHWGTNA